MDVFPSGSGPAAADSEDRFTGSDDTQARRHTGVIYHAEPDRDHHADHAHPKHSSASPGIQLAENMFYINMWYKIFVPKTNKARETNELLLISVPRR